MTKKGKEIIENGYLFRHNGTDYIPIGRVAPEEKKPKICVHCNQEISERLCEVCGCRLPPGKRKGARFCSKKCQSNAKYRRTKRQLVHYYEKKNEAE